MAKATARPEAEYLFSNLEEACLFHRNREIEQNVKFIFRQSTKNFGSAEIDENRPYRMNFFQSHPYITLGYKVLECHHGPKWKKTKTVEMFPEGHNYAACGQRRPTKKLGCEVTVCFRDILIFPEELVDPESMTKCERTTLAQRIRTTLNSGERKILLTYPDKQHIGHPIGLHQHDRHLENIDKCQTPERQKGRKKGKAKDEAGIGNQCAECLKTFASKDSLQQHVFRHTGIKPYECEECNMSFSMKSYLTRHMLKHSGEKLFFCDKCGKGFSRKSTLVTHLKSHSDERNFACNKCDKRFKMKQSLTAHMNTHTLEKMHVCHLCGKSFGSDRYLVQHMISHSDTRSYSCNICDKLFTSKQTWEEHARRHAGEKTVVCQVCSKRFYNKKELANHMSFHTNVTSFKCTACSMYFKMKRSLDFHTSKIHGRDYPCKFCGLALTSKRALTSHLFKEHRQCRAPRKGKLEKHEKTAFKRVSCSLCSLVLSNKYRFHKHLMKIHGISRQQHGNINYMETSNIESDNENELCMTNISIEESLDKTGRELDTANTGECFDRVDKNIGSFRVNHIDGNEIVVILNEDMTQTSHLPDSEGGNGTNMCTMVQDRNTIEGEVSNCEDVFIPNLDSNGEASQPEEVYVIVNTVADENDIMLNDKFDNGLDTNSEKQVYTQVDHEVIIQPESTAETVAQQDNNINQKLFTGFRKVPAINHVNDFGRNHRNNSIQTSEKDSPINETSFEDTLFDGILPQSGTSEEFSVFERRLMGSIKKLRNFNQYGPFLDNILEFVCEEKSKLNVDLHS